MAGWAVAIPLDCIKNRHQVCRGRYIRLKIKVKSQIPSSVLDQIPFGILLRIVKYRYHAYSTVFQPETELRIKILIDHLKTIITGSLVQIFELYRYLNPDSLYVQFLVYY